MATLIENDSLKYILEDIKEQIEPDTKTFWGLIVLLIVNIILMVFRVWADFRIKRLDRSIHKSNLIESKRVEIYETLFNKIILLTNVDHTQQVLLLDDITEFDKLISNNSLYISSQIEKISYDISDYFKIVANNSRKKNLLEEKKLLNKFKIEFNK